MTFLQAWLLAALPLASLPILIHLINLRRHRRVEWGAMMFLLAATRQQRGHTRLRHYLILLARTLAIATLIFLISRPIAGRWFGWLAGRPDTVLILLDRSASMAQQDLETGATKRSHALAQIVEALRRAGKPRQLALLESVHAEPWIIESVEALEEMSQTGIIDASSHLPSLLKSALDFLVANQAGRTDVWIVSDLQAADWHAESSQWAALRAGFSELKQPVRFHLLTYPDPPIPNRSVRITRLEREQNADVDRLHLDIVIEQADAASGSPSTPTSSTTEPRVKIPLGVVVDGNRTVLEIELDGPKTVIQDHIVPLDRQRTGGWGHVELPEDVQPRDNQFFFTYAAPQKPRSLIVSDAPGSTWPLRLAVQPAQATGDAPRTPDAEAPVQVVASNELPELDWQRLSLIVWQAPLPTGPIAQRLETFLSQGGQLLLFPPEGESQGSFHGVSWKDWGSVESSNDPNAPSIEHWRDDSGLLAHSDAGTPLPLKYVEVVDHRQADLPSSTVVLARLRNGHPLIASIPIDRGGLHVITTLPQAPHSNLARQGIVFFVLMQRALRAGNQRLLEEQFGGIGLVPPPPTTTAWQRIDGWPEGHLSTEQTMVAGVYQQTDRQFARNRPPSEDLTERLTRPLLESLFQGLDYRIVEDQLRGPQQLVTEIWRVFATAMLLALIAEAALCLPDTHPPVTRLTIDRDMRKPHDSIAA